MSQIKVGTASWHEISSYYPSRSISPAEKLGFYSAEFPLVEVDTSYYAIPSARTATNWAESTAEDFTFDVKAFRLFTGHQTSPRVLPPDIREALPAELAGKPNIYYKHLPPPLRERVWDEFERTLQPLDASSKLGVVLFQFPFWFMPKRESFSHIEECKQRLSKYRVAVEFRNKYWLGDDSFEDTLSFLRRNELSFVAVDEPQGFKSSVPPVADVTGEVGIVRFHGRNKDTWERKGLKSSSERFNYYYSRSEIEEWLPKIEMMKENASEVHLVVNTNNEDQGVVNARLIGELLGEGLKPTERLF